VLCTEGVKGLYNGFFAVALLSPLGHGLYFASYHWCKSSLSTQLDYPAMEFGIHAFSGVVANAVGGLIWTPMDVVKLHQQASVRKRFLTPFHGLLDLYCRGGSVILYFHHTAHTLHDRRFCCGQVFGMVCIAVTGQDWQPMVRFLHFIS
jgi:hypothetical protein